MRLRSFYLSCFFAIIIGLCSFSPKQAVDAHDPLTFTDPYTESFFKGIAVKEISNWLYNNIDKDSLPVAKTKQNEQIIKNTINLVVRTAADQSYRDSLLGNTLSLTDPRRYLLMGLFQSGQHAIFAYTFVKNWIREYMKSPKVMIESPREAPFFREEAVGQWESLSYWDHFKKIVYYPINQLYKYKDIAVASLLNMLIAQLAYMLFTKSQQNQLSAAQKLIGRFVTQELGVLASAYLADWVRSLVDDWLVVENSPYFKEAKLVPVTEKKPLEAPQAA